MGCGRAVEDCEHHRLGPLTARVGTLHGVKPGSEFDEIIAGHLKVGTGKARGQARDLQNCPPGQSAGHCKVTKREAQSSRVVFQTITLYNLGIKDRHRDFPVKNNSSYSCQGNSVFANGNHIL